MWPLVAKLWHVLLDFDEICAIGGSLSWYFFIDQSFFQVGWHPAGEGCQAASGEENWFQTATCLPHSCRDSISLRMELVNICGLRYRRNLRHPKHQTPMLPHSCTCLTTMLCLKKKQKKKTKKERKKTTHLLHVTIAWCKDNLRRIIWPYQ